MVNKFFRLVLTIDTLSIFWAVYLIEYELWLCGTKWRSILAYMLIPALLALICIILSDLLPTDSIEGGIESIELANDTLLPTYLGYFFIALSVPKCRTIIVLISGLLIIFLFFSQNLYFNPVFLLLGYKFYYVKSQNRLRILIITREKFNGVNKIKFDYLKRINTFTYIERGSRHGLCSSKSKKSRQTEIS